MAQEGGQFGVRATLRGLAASGILQSVENNPLHKGDGQGGRSRGKSQGT